MVKGGKRYSSLSNDGKWFAHAVTPENETKTRETCTSTGIMLTHIKSSLPQALRFERHPKWKTGQKSIEYPFSDHDNKYAFRDSITVFSHGVGLKKCPDDRRQHHSHFSLHHEGAAGSTGSTGDTGAGLTAYQADFPAKPSVNVATGTRRFTRNHRLKSAEAASAQARERFLWFGRDDSDPPGDPHK